MFLCFPLHFPHMLHLFFSFPDDSACYPFCPFPHHFLHHFLHHFFLQFTVFLLFLLLPLLLLLLLLFFSSSFFSFFILSSAASGINSFLLPLTLGIHFPFYTSPEALFFPYPTFFLPPFIPLIYSQKKKILPSVFSLFQTF